ncbi:hypothetical protein DOY81_014001, partial [Sarcophaga bullata]
KSHRIPSRLIHYKILLKMAYIISPSFKLICNEHYYQLNVYTTYAPNIFGEDLDYLLNTYIAADMEFNNRMQKYRSKLKENPEKLKEHLERERERDRKRRNLKKATMDEKALEEKRKKDRERQRKHRENKIKSLNMDKVSTQISASNLFESLKTQTGYADLHDAERFQIKEILKTLNAMERSLVAKYYCKLPWDIGSLRVLGILQELRILTATEYI